MPDRIIFDGSEEIAGYPDIKQIEIRFGKRAIIYTPKTLQQLVEWAFSRGAEDDGKKP